MRLFVASLLLIMCAGCDGGDCENPNPNYDSSNPESELCLTDDSYSASKAAAISLTNAMLFTNPGAIVIPGDFPADTTEATNQGELPLEPGSSSAIVTVGGAVGQDDPVVASLVWMEGADRFISLPAGTADSSSDDTLTNTFTVDESVCDDLCNIIHDVKCYEAAQTASGVVTQANLTTVILECTGSGDPVYCPSNGGSFTTGGGDLAGVSGNPTGDRAEGGESSEEEQLLYCPGEGEECIPYDEWDGNTESVQSIDCDEVIGNAIVCCGGPTMIENYLSLDSKCEEDANGNYSQCLSDNPVPAATSAETCQNLVECGLEPICK